MESLSAYHVTEAPAAVYYISNFLTQDEENLLWKRVYEAPKPKWTLLSHRRLQNWGGLPHEKGMVAEALPRWLSEVTERVSALGIFGGAAANHVLVNEYLAGQGIMAHEDGPMFHPAVCTASIGAHALLNLYAAGEPAGENLNARFLGSLLLEPRSLLILQERAYTSCLHDISAGALLNVVNKGRVLNWRLTALGRQDTAIYGVIASCSDKSVGFSTEKELNNDKRSENFGTDGKGRVEFNGEESNNLTLQKRDAGSDACDIAESKNGIDELSVENGSQELKNDQGLNNGEIDGKNILNKRCKVYMIPGSVSGDDGELKTELPQFLDLLSLRLENEEKSSPKTGNLESNSTKCEAFDNELTLAFYNKFNKSCINFDGNSCLENKTAVSQQSNADDNKSCSLNEKNPINISTLLSERENIDVHPTVAGDALALDEWAGLAGCGCHDNRVLLGSVDSNPRSFILRRGTRVSLTIRLVPKVIKTKLFLGRK